MLQTHDLVDLVLFAKHLGAGFLGVRSESVVRGGGGVGYGGTYCVFDALEVMLICGKNRDDERGRKYLSGGLLLVLRPSFLTLLERVSKVSGSNSSPIKD